MRDFRRMAAQFSDDMREIQDRGGAAGAHVEYQGIRRLPIHRGHERRHNVGDIDEISALQAVAEDFDLILSTQTIAKDRDHA